MLAASLDRYLQAIGQPQVFGTQFETKVVEGTKEFQTTQDPFEPTLISDALRKALDVRTLAEGEARRTEIEASYRSRAKK